MPTPVSGISAVDGAPALWSDTGFWRAPAVRRLYGWRTTLRLFAAAIGL